jgi:hypothetical protein
MHRFAARERYTLDAIQIENPAHQTIDRHFLTINKRMGTGIPAVFTGQKASLYPYNCAGTRTIDTTYFHTVMNEHKDLLSCPYKGTGKPMNYQ